MNLRCFAFSALTIAALAGQAMGQSDEYEFDSDSGTVKLNGNETHLFNGVPVQDAGISGGARTWVIFGDMNVPSMTSVTFKGSSLARVLVGRNMIVAAGASIAANASAETGGPGGGQGGAGGKGGLGGDGGTGGGGVNGVDGDPGGNSSGPAPGQGGINSQRGGDGGTGTVVNGMGGGAGFGRMIGFNGDQGEDAAAGGAGALGTNNFAMIPAVAQPRAGGIGGNGGNIPGGGGLAGPLSGASGQSGEPGTSGYIGFTGGDGRDGANANGFAPTSTAINILNGGNGGNGGAGGGGGGGGGGGTTGGGGGGGAAGDGDPVKPCTGGGGGGGGAGGSGGEGGRGGVGATGGKGGGGGGGVQFIVQGRIDHAGSVAALGGDFAQGSDGSQGAQGDSGGMGGPGGSGGSGGCGSGASGGSGGDGGMGGQGGEGGIGGAGGNGGGGSGGVVFIAGTLVTGSGAVDIGGGFGEIARAAAGRVLYGDGAVGSPTFQHPTNPLLTSRTLDFVPTVASPYFASFVTPNIVAATQGGDDLDGGPGPFGVLPSSLADATIAAAIAGTPQDARAALLRFDVGPVGFDVGYNISSVAAVAEQFDMYVLVNLRDAASAALVNGAIVAEFPFHRRAEFGGDNTAGSILIPEGASWCVLGPEIGVGNIQLAVADAQGTLSMADPADGACTLMYLIGPPCEADFNGDGTVNSADFFEFLTAFFNDDPAADFNDDGTVNSQDFFNFLAAFFAGCP